MSNFWNWYIITIVLVNIIGVFLILYLTRKIKVSDLKDDKYLSHSFDGIVECDNPLPRWWFITFILCIIFALGYLVLYPGLGKNPGLLKWTSSKQLDEEVLKAKEIYEPLFAKYSSTSVEELSHNPSALKMAHSLFVNNCAPCHGQDASGGIGFPNLTLDFWRWGGKPENIKQTITNGRIGVMPPLKAMLKDEQDIINVANYVMSISGHSYNKDYVVDGEKIFRKICFTCHGINAKGNTMLGAPDLTRGIRIYGTDIDVLIDTIKYGRKGIMPSHKDILSKDQIHLLTAYVYNLSFNK